MKLGVVAEPDRAPDSPDTVVVVEPSVGSLARSKGQLYLLVTSRIPGPRSREATRLVAEAVRSEYYYDESAGIRVCIVKAIHAANKRLAHIRDRAALGRSGDSGPIGVGIAVVRDNELYVSTVGPAEAYLSRSARLSTLPDPHRERGLPAADIEPDVWRGELNVGDQLVLVSPNLIAALGPDELKDALVALHPQSAMEHLHHRFLAVGGGGSDGALAIEAAEVVQSRVGRAPVPVKPPEPLAGTPDRSPIPLADTVSGGVSAAQAGARRARHAAGGLAGELILRLQDALPSRSLPSRRVTPMTARREMQRRAAIAVLVFVGVVGSLGLAVFVLGGHQPSGQVIPSAKAGEAALASARANLSRVAAPGIDLVANDPRKAQQLLDEALSDLKDASAAGIPDSTITPIRAQVVALLDRLYGMIDVADTTLFAFPPEAKADLRALVKGPDGAAYVLDAATKTVFRIDAASKKAVAIFREGQKAAGSVEAAPKFLTVGALDLVVVDVKNTVWRWRPADASGKGTTTKIKVCNSAEWGDDITSVGTFVRDASAGLYNFYTIDPSAQQILAYIPAADGGGFPCPPSNRLSAARPVDSMRSLYIDGDIWVTDAGKIERIVNGKIADWEPEAPPDGSLRSAPSYATIASGSDRLTGRIYGYDPANERVVALGKVKGDYLAQYRLAGASTAFADLRGWYVEPGLGDIPDTLVWITADGLHRALLESATAPTASPSPAPSAAPATSPKVSPKPTKK
jgi:hypothetical protein